MSAALVGICEREFIQVVLEYKDDDDADVSEIDRFDMAATNMRGEIAFGRLLDDNIAVTRYLCTLYNILMVIILSRNFLESSLDCVWYMYA